MIAVSTSHPLREDVSWNTLPPLSSRGSSGHPLREDVSWNALLAPRSPHTIVILFVRMWVEISLSYQTMAITVCHPLREDVSWNKFPNPANNIAGAVILFVRMWVEMLVRVQLGQLHTVILFVRMWVEMAVNSFQYRLCAVILFVRMWVEIVIILPVTAPLLSSSSWGCELKYLFFQCPCDRIQSSSSWGCELKCLHPF